MAVPWLAGCTPDPAIVRDGEWPEYDVLGYVDPLIGTGGDGAQVTGLNPGAAWPLGQVLVGPDTRSSVLAQPAFLHYGGYHAGDDLIDGFSHTHGSGMGIVDFGAVHVMPRGGGFEPHHTLGATRAAPFDKGTEHASAGFYDVTLADDGTRVEIAASAHGAHHRYTFQGGGAPVVVFDLGYVLPGVAVGEDSELTLFPDGRVSGYQRVSGGYSARFGGIRTWFEGTLEPAPIATGAWVDPAAPTDGSSQATGATGGGWAVFPEGTSTVELRLAVSVVDADGAAANLAAEATGGSFDEHRATAEDAWRDWLDTARIWGGPDQETTRRIFHTAHYRTGLMPREYSDVDGRYRGLDGEVHEAPFRYLSDLSLWDTYRTTHPWYALAHPDAQLDAVRSLVRMAEDGGSLPRWPMAHGYTGGMLGSPASIVLSETVQKGLSDGWDPEQALEFVLAQADGPTEPEGRPFVEDWVTLDFVPADRDGSVSHVVEYAWADAAGARFAAALGRDDDARRLLARSRNWREVFDPAVGFAHGRARDGAFTPFVGPATWTSDYVEGNAWHYLWQAPYDVPGLIEVQHDGDAGAFADRYATYWEGVRAEVDDNFPDELYWHGNEPVMHYAWLGSLAGDPASSVEAVDWVVHHRYADDPVGLDGNDDAGTLSAWYLWATLGVYPVAGTDEYAVAAPQIEHAEVETVGGRLSIDAPPGGAALADRLTVDGEPIDGWTLHHAELLGTTLSFER